MGRLDSCCDVRGCAVTACCLDATLSVCCGSETVSAYHVACAQRARVMHVAPDENSLTQQHVFWTLTWHLRMDAGQAALPAQMSRAVSCDAALVGWTLPTAGTPAVL